MRTPMHLRTLPPLWRTSLPLGLALLLGASCSFTKFDDLEEQAPGARVGQAGGESDGFGRPLVGIARLDEAPGGELLIAGTGGNPALNSAIFNATGGLSTNQSKREDFDEKLELQGFGVRAMAPVPPGKTTADLSGPFAYVGATASSTGKVLVVDLNRYRAPLGTIITRTDDEFGISLAPAKWDPTDAEDLIVGAAGRVFFLHANPWPTFTVAPEGGYRPSSNATQVYQAVAAGDLDPTTPEHEVVVAAPERNYIAVIHGVSSCFNSTRGKTANGDGGVDAAAPDAGAKDGGVTPDQGSADAGSPGDCSKVTHFEIPLPENANYFGGALLIADVDEDGSPDLVVGAPETNGGAGAVYVYKFAKSNFTNKTIGAPITVLSPPEGVTSFGTALALGKFDGEAKRILAIGAPAATVSGAANAGKVVLYRLPDLAKPINTLALANPEGSDLLGAALTVMPFRKGAEIKDVLVASIKKAVVVFFANTTSDHKDYRK